MGSLRNLTLSETLWLKAMAYSPKSTFSKDADVEQYISAVSLRALCLDPAAYAFVHCQGWQNCHPLQVS